MNVTENHCAECENLVLLLHGLEGSSADWTHKDGYTKGGNLAERLTRDGISWIAPDLYGHGAFVAQENDFDQTNISDELWPLFLSRSVDAVLTLLDGIVNRHGYTGLTVITYSAGCHVGVMLIRRVLSLQINRFFMAAPCPEREYDDEYSLHNNLDCFNGYGPCVFAGKGDAEVPIEDVHWFFSQIEDTRKELFIYDSGHSLPAGWTDDALSQLCITKK